MTKKGFYIILEGGEGCGKDTHAELLKKFLVKKGFDVILTREPGGTKEAEQIRKILINKKNNLSPTEELFLFEASRTSNYSQIIKPNLEKGKVVIKTRGWPSSVAHQGYAGGINLKFIGELNKKATQGVKPDLLFVIDVSAKLGLEREIDSNRFASKGIKYHKKVNQGYLEIAKRQQNIAKIIPYLDGGLDKMQNTIREHVESKLNL